MKDKGSMPYLVATTTPLSAGQEFRTIFEGELEFDPTALFKVVPAHPSFNFSRPNATPLFAKAPVPVAETSTSLSSEGSQERSRNRNQDNDEP
jgi:hypothetical protein